MIWIPLAIAGGLAVAGGVAYYATRPKPFGLVGIRSQPAPVVVSAQPVKLKLTGAKVAKPDRVAKEAPDSPFDVSERNGFRPVWVTKAEPITMEWGACVWDLKSAQTRSQMDDESRAVQAITGAIGWAVEYVIAIVKAATLDVSICWRLEIPAARWEIEGMALYSPCDPRGGAGGIEGFNPMSGRPGYPGTGYSPKIDAWPLGPVPANAIGGAWIRNLGDVWGWGEDVFQVITMKEGEWRSFPMMGRAGWRMGLIMAGESDKGGRPFGKLVDYFKNNRCDGQDYKLILPSTRVKAMNRFHE